MKPSVSASTRTGPSTVVVHAGDVPFTITAPQTWLTGQHEFLAQYLTPPPGDHDLPGFSLRVHIDMASLRQVVDLVGRSRPTSTVEPVPGLVLNQALLPDGRRCYTIATDQVEQRPGGYAVAVRDREIDLFLDSDGPHAHRYPIRLVREAMLRTYEDAGGVVFHAAGIEAAGRGVMICGPRAAGKTTTTAALLSRPGAGLLSNDRLVADHDGRIVAVPLPVPTGRGTIEAFPQLRRAVGADLAGLPAGFAATTKYAFTARQFATAFGAPLLARSHVDLILVPRLRDGDQPCRIRELSTQEARTVLAASCFTPRDEFWVQPWVVPRSRTDDTLRQQANQVTDHLATVAPCLEVSFGVRNPIDQLTQVLGDVVNGSW